MKKKILPLLLAVCLAVGMIPATVFADDGEENSGSNVVETTCEEHSYGEWEYDEDEKIYYRECEYCDEKETIDSETIATIEELINELPTNDEMEEMSTSELEEVNEAMSDIYDMIYDVMDDDAAEELISNIEDLYEKSDLLNSLIISATSNTEGITEAGGSLGTGTYKLTSNIVLSDNNLTIPQGAEVTIDLAGYTITGNGNSSVITVYGKLTLTDSTADGPNEIGVSGLPEEVYKDETFTAGTILGDDQKYTTYYSVSSLNGETLKTTYYSYTSGAITGGVGKSMTYDGGKDKIGGGGIFVETGGTFILESGTITNNTLNKGDTNGTEGAGVFIAGVADDNGDLTSYGSFVMSGGAVSGNTANDGAGGGISNFGKMEIAGGIITGNVATGTGGGIRTWSKCVVEGISDAYICNNISGNNGGGASISSNNDSTISDTVFSGNTGMNGGGVYAKNATFDNVSIVYNFAQNDDKNALGGGVYLSGNTTLENSIVANNICGTEQSTKSNSGGGIYVSSTENVIEDVYIINNKCLSTGYVQGGAVSMAASAGLNISDAVISNNQALHYGNENTSRGGAIFATTGALTLSNVEISNNKAYSTYSTATGGGIHVEDALTLKIADCTITENTAKSDENTAIQRGGGLYVQSGATLTMTDSEVSNNTAGIGGGGIYTQGSTLTLENCVIDSNTAMTGNGGGIWVNDTNISVKLIDTEVSNNTAGVNGGGIYTSSVSALAVSGNTKVMNNTADNVYLPNGKYITIAEDLTSGATIGVTTEIEVINSIQITTTETGTTYYESGYQYFIPDADGVISNANTGQYVEFIKALSNYAKVTFDLTNADITSDHSTIVYVMGNSETVTVEPADGYSLPSSVTITTDDGSETYAAGTTVGEVTFNADGSFTITAPTGDSNTAYTITLEALELFEIETTGTSYGTITPSTTSATAGTEITITVTPDSGYEVDEITVVDEDGNEVEVTVSGNTGTFIMPESAVTVTVTFEETSSGTSSKTSHSSYSLSQTTGSSSSSASSTTDEDDSSSTSGTTSTVFTDLSTDHPYYDAIMTAYENGWMVGTSGTTFEADAPLTRAMAAKILHNLAGNPDPEDVAPFLDVVSGEWYSEAIAWAYEQGIVVGYDAQTFGPDDYVTTEQFNIMLAKLLGQVVPDYVGGAPNATRGWIAYMITA